jgi:hypothetical protein
VRDRPNALASGFFTKLKFHKPAKHCGACGSWVRVRSQKFNHLTPPPSCRFLSWPRGYGYIFGGESNASNNETTGFLED